MSELMPYVGGTKVRVQPSMAEGWRGHLMLPVEIALGFANVRTCPVCGRLFEPIRARQMYCGRDCNNRVAQARFREARCQL